MAYTIRRGLSTLAVTLLSRPEAAHLDPLGRTRNSVGRMQRELPPRIRTRGRTPPKSLRHRATRSETLSREIKRGHVPRLIQLCPNRVGWPVEVINKMLEWPRMARLDRAAISDRSQTSSSPDQIEDAAVKLSARLMTNVLGEAVSPGRRGDRRSKEALSSRRRDSRLHSVAGALVCNRRADEHARSLAKLGGGLWVIPGHAPVARRYRQPRRKTHLPTRRAAIGSGSLRIGRPGLKCVQRLGAKAQEAILICAQPRRRQVLNKPHVVARARYEKARLVHKLRHARERKKEATGKCEGRKSHKELRPEVVKEAKRLRRASPLNGERRSLRKISEELAAMGFLNERGKPYNPYSIKAMLEE